MEIPLNKHISFNLFFKYYVYNIYTSYLMDEQIDDQIILQSVQGINKIRPPTLDFIKLKDTKDYTEYSIITKKINKGKKEDANPLTNYLNSFIFCNETLNIKMPKKKFMIKNNKKRFAYVVGMFPNPKNKKPAYLDGCILAALGLKRQKTNADIICMITHDIDKDTKQKLEVVFDKVMYVPYISPYDMGGKGKLKTIMMDPDLFKNCPNYTKDHPYVHVFFKLHIFNPTLFPYEKVCFVDSDLVPLNYYDSLFMLDCPAGFVEYRKKWPYLESYNWDRCDYLEHGKPIPKEITDVDKKTGADVNAGLLLVEPNQKEYDEMIHELTLPTEQWMGPDKYHKGFWSFDFDAPTGIAFVDSSYCYPEQNYLTKRYSGSWKFIEFAFQSWTLDPCNSFGIHMAAFNPKPWFKQPIGVTIKLNHKFLPYIEQWRKKDVKIPVTLKENSKENYDNISYSYEIFNEVILWGLINFKKLQDFFIHDTQIHGTKISFDKDDFKKLSTKENMQYKLLKNFKKDTPLYDKLSLSQQYICNLLKNDKETETELKDKYLQICSSKKIGNATPSDYNMKIIEYPNHIVRYQHNQKLLMKEGQIPLGKYKGKQLKGLKKKDIEDIKDSDEYARNKVFRNFINRQKGGRRRTNKKTNKVLLRNKLSKRRLSRAKRIKKLKHNTTLYYFSMKGCFYCNEFNPLWNQLVKKYKGTLTMKKIVRDTNPRVTKTFNVTMFPTIILVKGDTQHIFQEDRTLQTIVTFLQKHRVI